MITINSLKKDLQKNIELKQSEIKQCEEMNIYKPHLVKDVEKNKHLLNCLEMLEIFVQNTIIINCDKEYPITIKSEISDQKMLVKMINFIIKENKYNEDTN